jgi:hypothetical protein
MMSDATSEDDSVEVELEDLISRISDLQELVHIWFEPGTAPPPAIQAGLVSGRLALVNVQGDWHELPHYPGRYIRIQKRKIAMPGFALAAEEERRVLAEVKEPMFLRGEVRITKSENFRRTIHSAVQAAFDEEKRLEEMRLNSTSDELPPNESLQKKFTPLEAAISRRLEANEQPGITVPWALFCHSVRCDCDGFVDPEKKRQPKRGYGDKSIQRIVKQQQPQRRRRNPRTNETS